LYFPDVIHKERQQMTKTRTVSLIVFLGVAGVTWSLHFLPGDAGAQSRGSRQKWAYATLNYDEPTGTDFGSVAAWTTGTKITGAVWEKGTPHPFLKVYADLGGKAQDASLGVLLDQIGQEGWELASHCRTAAPQRTTQTWTFKRQVE
jgi:hypothetical protein